MIKVEQGENQPAPTIGGSERTFVLGYFDALKRQAFPIKRQPWTASVWKSEGLVTGAVGVNRSIGWWKS